MSMYRTDQGPSAVWLRTNHPVVSVHPSGWNHLAAVEIALSKGVLGVPDPNRPGFYELEIDDSLYYIHIPSRIMGIYLIYARRKPVTHSCVSLNVEEAEAATR